MYIELSPSDGISSVEATAMAMNYYDYDYDHVEE